MFLSPLMSIHFLFILLIISLFPIRGEDHRSLRHFHPRIVPQLLPNYTGNPLPSPESVPCRDAQLLCAYRSGCGLALQNYILGCSDLVLGKTSKCSSHCKHSLIALMSTFEGQRLMKCNCSSDEFCHQSKVNLKVCASSVLYATRKDTLVSCTTAQWICGADASCATALDYYNLYCGAMFKGRTCSSRCLNSISILQRQKSASKLETCVCDGTEDYDCLQIKENMKNLCFTSSLKEEEENLRILTYNDISLSSSSSSSSSSTTTSSSSSLFFFVVALSIISLFFHSFRSQMT